MGLDFSFFVRVDFGSIKDYQLTFICLVGDEKKKGKIKILERMKIENNILNELDSLKACDFWLLVLRRSAVRVIK